MRIALTFFLLIFSHISLSQQAVATTFKDPNCGCCGKWIDHIQQAGFISQEHNTRNMSQVKNRLAIPKALYSCHSSEINGYVFEGHIPAAVIKQFLAKPPKSAKGLAVPNMPIGSPGMEVAGRANQDYTVYMFFKDGSYKPYTTISGQ